MNNGYGTRRFTVFCFLLMAIGAAYPVGAADGTWTNTSYGAWSDTAKWVDGTVAGSGGTATFMAPSGTYEVTNDLGTVTLSGFNANTNSADGSAAAEWRIVGGTNELVAPALIYTRANSLSARLTTLADGRRGPPDHRARPPLSGRRQSVFGTYGHLARQRARGPR